MPLQECYKTSWWEAYYGKDENVNDSAETEDIEHEPQCLFNAVLDCEEILSAAKSELQKAQTIFGNAVAAAQAKLDAAWKEVGEYMASTGEYELEFPAPAGQKYVVNWSTPRQSVKVADIEALPEELVKIEKKPKLKEIGERLKEGWKTNAAKFELGEKHLQWKSVKHKEQSHG